MCHSRTTDLAEECRSADILCTALGRPRFITADMLKPGAVVIDVGINRIEENGRARLCGDVDFARRCRKVRGHHSRARRCRPHDHCHAPVQYRSGMEDSQGNAERFVLKMLSGKLPKLSGTRLRRCGEVLPRSALRGHFAIEML